MFGITAVGVATTGYFMSLGSIGLFVLSAIALRLAHYGLQIAGADYSHRCADCFCRFSIEHWRIGVWPDKRA